MEFSKFRGQHFLTDKKIVEKIIAAAELAGGDTVLEVGPGLGVMTREILPHVRRLIAVELDPFFVRELRKEFAEDLPRRIEIVEGDILKMKISDLFLSFRRTPESSMSELDPDFRRDDGGETGYKLITNLPYNITSAFLKKFLIEPPAPERIVVMLQKEVAERIISARTKNPGTRAKARCGTSQEPNSNPTNLLGLMCNLYAECGAVCKVPSTAFAPPPKVDSTVIVLKPYSVDAFIAKWGIERAFAEDIMAFAAKFFAEPRKKMCGMLGKGLRERCRAALQEIDESVDSRPAVLSIEKWVELWKIVR